MLIGYEKVENMSWNKWMISVLPSWKGWNVVEMKRNFTFLFMERCDGTNTHEVINFNKKQKSLNDFYAFIDMKF